MRFVHLLFVLALGMCLAGSLAWAQSNAVTRDVIIGEQDLTPITLDVDADGNIYVGGGSEIWKYDKTGARMAVWQFAAARPIRITPEQKIGVGRTWERDSQVRILDTSGRQISNFGMRKWLHGDAVGFDVPGDLLFDPNGSAWTLNTHHVEETEARRDVKNGVWGAVWSDPNGGRIMVFDLAKDPAGNKPRYIGTFANDPPEKGGPADGLHRPSRIAFDSVHKKIFVLDMWGVTRWNWPDGAFEKRIIRVGADYTNGLLAVAADGKLYTRLNTNMLQVYDWEGNKLTERPEIDVNNARDLRITPDGCFYLCYPDRRISVKKYAPDGKLLLCRGLDVLTLKLGVDGKVFAAGARIPVTAKVEDRRQLYGVDFPELAEVSRSLWIRPFAHGATWTAMPIQREGDAEYIILPATLTGAAQLRLSTSGYTASPLDESAASVEINIAVRDPQAKDGALTVCTDRQQRLFCAGEWLRLNVIGRSQTAVAQERVTVTMLTPYGKPLVETTLPWSIPANAATTRALDLRLPVLLPEGTYTVQAISPALGRATFPFEVRVSREKGRFKMFVALDLGKNTPAPVTEAYLRIAAKNGLTHDVSRYISANYEFGGLGDDLARNQQMRALLATDPRLPAPETAELPSRMRVALYEMGANGMHIWPEMMGWENDTVNRTDKQKIQDKQNLAKWALWGIKSPAQDGFLWNESNWWGIDHQRLGEEWAQATGKSVEAMKKLRWGALRTYDPPLTGQPLADTLSYHEYMAKHLYPHYYAAWKAYAQSMRPRVTGAGVPALYPSNWPEWCAQPLDGVVSYHQVEQIAEPYMQLNDGAFMLHGGKPFWAGVEIYPDPGTGEYMTRQLLPALLYGAEGFWANDMGGLRGYLSFTASENIRAAQRVQAIADLQQVLEPVGMRLRNTTYRAQLGIYFPRAIYVQQGNPAFAGDSYIKRVSAALIASFHAHLPARIVFDEELKAGKVTDVKYLLLPGVKTELTAADMTALAAFAKKGTLLVSADSSEACKALGKVIDVDFSTFKDDDYVDWFTQDSRVEKRLRVLTLAETMRKALAPYLTPPVQVNDPDIWYALRDGKDNAGRPITYLIVVNQNYPENLEPRQLWKMTASFSSVLPVLRTAQLPPAYRYAYDLLGGKALQVTNGRLALDFRRFPARVFALSATKLAAADLQEQAPPAAPATKSPAPALEVAPEVDLFYAEKIRQALHAGRSLYLLAPEKTRNTTVDALRKAGVPVEPATDPETQEGVYVILATPGDKYWQDANDLLPVRLTENVPGRERALLAYVPALAPAARDAVLVATADEAGMNKAIGKLAELLAASKPIPETRLLPPATLPAPPATLQRDTVTAWGARLTTIKAAGNMVAVGAAEWGNNLFLLDGQRGQVQAATKAGRFYVDDLCLSADGQQIGAEAIYPEDVNGYLELFDRAGTSTARYARDGITSHANWSYCNFTSRLDIFSFALSPAGDMVYSCSNAGLSAMQRDGTVRWRHDYGKLNAGFEELRNKWAGRIDLSPDGRFLAVALTHELYQAEPYRGFSKVQLVDAGAGTVLWEAALEPIERPSITAVAISPDGKTVAALDSYYGLLFLRDGQIIKQRRGSFTRIAWGRNGQLYALVSKEGSEGVLALTADGLPVWQHEQFAPILGMAPAENGTLVIADGDRRITLLAPDGTPRWQASIEATGTVTAAGDAVFACDWHGNVYRFALADGKQAWKVNLTDRVWREDLETLAAKPYAGKTFGIQARRAAEAPLAGDNLALQATVRAGGTGGWFSTGKVRVDGKQMADGQLNDLEKAWLGPSDQYKAGNWSRYIWVEFTWPKPVTITGLAIHEDERHPESWPYDAAVQVWKDGVWQDVAVSQMMPGPWHNLTLPAPLTAEKIRYCVGNILDNNVWTDEVRVIGGH